MKLYCEALLGHVGG